MDTHARILMLYAMCLFSKLPMVSTTCIPGDFCEYEGVEAHSPTTIVLPHYAGMIRQSCTHICLEEPRCTAVTLDPKRDLCRLHIEPKGGGGACVSLRNGTDTILWVFQTRNHCPDVRIFTNWQRGGNQGPFLYEPSNQYRNSHLYYGNSYTSKMAYFYCNGT